MILFRRKGDRGSKDVAKSALEGAWVFHWLQSIGKKRFRCYFITPFGVGEGQDVSQETWQVELWQPSQLLAAMILWGDCQFHMESVSR